MSEKAYAQGSSYPELAAGKLRLYSMRFCPYAQRTRLVLANHNIDHEVVNINLTTKPDWYLARTPGLVPALEQDDKVVVESVICDEYLDEVYGKKKLLPTDPYQKARMKILMEQFSKVVEKFYVVLKSATTDTDREKALSEMSKFLKPFEDALEGKYFGGDTLSMLDVHMWPWIERIPGVEKVRGVQMLPQENFPKLCRWVETMLESPVVKATYFDTESHLGFFSSAFSEQPTDYDYGLK